MNESCQFVANDLVTQRQALRANSRKPGDLGPNPRCLLGASFNRHGGKTSDLIATLPAEAASRLSVLLSTDQPLPGLPSLTQHNLSSTPSTVSRHSTVAKSSRAIRYEHRTTLRMDIGHRTGPGRNCPATFTMTRRCSW